MHSATEFLRDLAMVLCVAAVTTVLFRKLRQPVVLGYLLAGVLVGPHVEFPLFARPDTVGALSELGVILVMFGIGLEFSLRRLGAVLPTAGFVGLLQVSVMVWLGYLAGQALGWSVSQSVFAGAALSISSTVIVARLLEEHRVRAPVVDLVYGVLLVQDVAAVLMLALLASLAGGTSDDGALLVLAAETGRLALVLAAVVAGGYLVVPRAIRAVARLGSGETLLVASVGLAFAFSLLAHEAGYSVALGAFLAGTLVAESGRAESIERLVHPVRDLFAAVFFVAVGMGVDPRAMAAHPGAIALLTAVAVTGKLLSVSVGAVLSGHDVRTSVQGGLYLAPIGEFSYILVGLGVASGAAGPELLPVIVAGSVLTVFAAPWMTRVAEPLSLWVDRRLPHAVQTFVTLHGTWLARLRERRRTGRSPARRLALALALDGVLLAALVIGTSLAAEPLRALVHDRLHWRALPAGGIVLAAAALLAVPLLLGLVAAARKLGGLLAGMVLPPAAAGRADFGAAPRRALLVALQLGVILAVLMPVLALTQPFVPLLAGLPVVLLLLALVGVTFWRSTAELQEHVKAGAEVLLEALRAAGPSDDWRDGAHAGPAATAPAVEQILPGLGSVAEMHVRSGTRSDGASLRELDLRGRTGATVVAIRRAGQHLTAPGGSTRLQAGDVLAVAGTEPALRAANAELAGRPPSA